MSPHDPEALSRLRGFLEVTRVVRSEEELGELLASIAKSISESLGFATVVVHLYRPAWDDFEVTTVYGDDPGLPTLLGATYDWKPQMGSLVSPDHLERVSDHVEDARAKGVSMVSVSWTNWLAAGARAFLAKANKQ